VFGSRNDRLLKHYGRSVRAINSLEPSMAALPDHGLGAKTLELRERFAKRVQGVPEEERDAAEKGGARRAPAGVLRRGSRGGEARAQHAPFRRAADRGMVLHDGKISEMRTGEARR